MIKFDATTRFFFTRPLRSKIVKLFVSSTVRFWKVEIKFSRSAATLATMVSTVAGVETVCPEAVPRANRLNAKAAKKRGNISSFRPAQIRNDMKIQLVKLAHARSGDKGDTANVGLIALKDEYYPLLVREVTAERVKEHFGEMVKGDVERFELPNLGALNFLLHGALGGGGTLSLMTDAQGKTFSTALLRMYISVEDAEAGTLGLEQ